MGKRIFIAVGSTSVKGLTHLVRRLKSENIFDRYNDEYFAIDSEIDKDQSPLNTFGHFANNCSRIHAIRLTMVQDDEAACEFQPGWMGKLPPPIDAGGVGGNREVSAKTRSWRDVVWNKIGSVLSPEDIVVVIGSAFGGTSTGMFWNVADFIDLKIAEKRESKPSFNGITVLGFIVLPESITKDTYKIGPNFCDFLHDMQLTHWRRRLESEYIDFKVPVYAQGDAEHYPLHIKAGPSSHGVDNSFLPFSSVYWLPTPAGETSLVDVLLAETLLASCYVGIQRGYQASGVDRFTQVRNQLAVEERCFSGINMLVLKSGRMQSMRKWFYINLKKACNEFNPEKPADSDVYESYILNHLETIFYTEQPESLNVAALKKKEASAVADYAKFANFFVTLETDLDNVIASEVGYNSFSFNDMMDILLDEKNSSQAVHLTHHLMSNAYSKFLTKVGIKANLLIALRKDILDAAKNLKKESETRKKCLPVQVFNKKQDVDAELLSEFHAVFAIKLQQLRDAARCQKTLLLNELQFLQELSQLKAGVSRVFSCVENELAKLTASPNKSFVIEGNVIDVDLPAEVKVECEPFLVTMLKVAMNADSIMLEKAISTCEVTALEALQKACGTCLQDPLKDATVAVLNGVSIPSSDDKESRNLETYSNCFQLAQCDNHHYHFVVKLGELPSGFNLTNGNVGKGLKLDTFSRMEMTGDQFLSVNHGVGTPQHSWCDSPQLVDFGKVGKGPVDIKGLWLGTVRDTFSIQEILRTVYPGNEPLSSWHDEWADWQRKLGYSRSLMSLKHMIYWGVVLQVVEAKVSGAWQSIMSNAIPHKYAVELVFKNKNGTREKHAPILNLQMIGFFQNQETGNLVLTRVHKDWVSFFSNWFQSNTPNEGFDSFFPCGSAFEKIQKADEDGLSFIRLRIENSDLTAMDQLRRYVTDGLDVQFQRD